SAWSWSSPAATPRRPSRRCARPARPSTGSARSSNAPPARPPPSWSEVRRRAAAAVPGLLLADVRRVLLALLLAAAWPAFAANDAPAELVEPLRTRTLLGRWIDEPGFEADQLPLFVERAKEEAAAIVRAAGYFSARVAVTVEPARAGGLARVRIAVDAGARTTVNRFDLTLDGPPAAQAMRETLLDRWPLREGAFFRST